MQHVYITSTEVSPTLRPILFKLSTGTLIYYVSIVTWSNALKGSNPNANPYHNPNLFRQPEEYFRLRLPENDPLYKIEQYASLV